MIWLICELNGIGYRFTSCDSMEEAEYINFELWEHRKKICSNSIQEFETFLLVNSFRRYKIRNNKKSSFNFGDERFTSGIFSQKKFNNFSDAYLSKIKIHQNLQITEYFDGYNYMDILFTDEIMKISLGKIDDKRFILYTYFSKIDNHYLNIGNN